MGRLLAGHGDEFKTASSKLDEALGYLRQVKIANATAASQRVDEVVATARIPEEIEDGFRALTWDATCAVVTGDVPDDPSAVAEWLSEFAIRYGLEFLGEGASQHAYQVVASLQGEGAWSDAQSMCSDIGGVLDDL